MEGVGLGLHADLPDDGGEPEAESPPSTPSGMERVSARTRSTVTRPPRPRRTVRRTGHPERRLAERGEQQIREPAAEREVGKPGRVLVPGIGATVWSSAVSQSRRPGSIASRAAPNATTPTRTGGRRAATEQRVTTQAAAPTPTPQALIATTAAIRPIASGIAQRGRVPATSREKVQGDQDRANGTMDCGTGSRIGPSPG